ncbi:MAG TPA: hypothetical protein VNZ47_09400 [Candidatus Dormibacteraeota bacterium]|jgi:hypothetical protein|nr:hypothetical protein [Candidatus Dormibacteraeota bacterium]
MNRIAILLTGAILLAVSAVAQESAPREKVRSFTLTQEGPMSVMPPTLNMMFQRDRMPEGEISFFSAEMAGAGETVTAAPYTATATTESTQVLGDGNRIVNKTSAFVARDSQGRTRREADLHRIGPLQVDSPKMVFINDPTTHTQYIFHQGGDATKVVRSDATWSEGPQIIDLHGAGEPGMMKKKVMIRTQAGPGRAMEKDNAEQVKNEDLGKQTIEGVSAEGKRETVTIPAGQIGNERPIEIVSETWFSPELHTMVLRKHSDPRVGESTYRLTDIKRNEPDASLFQPPAGTKVSVEPMLELHRDITPPKQ